MTRVLLPTVHIFLVHKSQGFFYQNLVGGSWVAFTISPLANGQRTLVANTNERYNGWTGFIVRWSTKKRVNHVVLAIIQMHVFHAADILFSQLNQPKSVFLRSVRHRGMKAKNSRVLQKWPLRWTLSADCLLFRLSDFRCDTWTRPTSGGELMHHQPLHNNIYY